MNNKKKNVAEKSFTCPTRKQQKFTMERARVHILLQYTIEIPKKRREKKTPHVECSFRLLFILLLCLLLPLHSPLL